MFNVEKITLYMYIKMCDKYDESQVASFRYRIDDEWIRFLEQ
jgi:hypothetical protein